MTATKIDSGAGITPEGCALTDVVAGHLNSDRRPRKVIAPQIDDDLWAALWDGRGEPGVDDLTPIEQGLGLEPGQLAREAAARTVPIVCPEWCTFDDYCGDGVIVHMSEHFRLCDDQEAWLASSTLMSGEVLPDDPPSIHMSTMQLTLAEAEELATTMLALVKVARA